MLPIWLLGGQVMNNIDHYLDKDGMISPTYLTDPKNQLGSQNSYFYTGLYMSLSSLEEKYFFISRIRRAFDLFRYYRNSQTNDVVSYDDLYALLYTKPLSIRLAFMDGWLWHPARTSNALRWWFGRNPVFVSCILWPSKKSLIRDISMHITGWFEKGSTPFLLSYLISELYLTSKSAKDALRENAYKRWPNGMVGAFQEHFGVDHPICKLAENKLK